LNCIKNSEEKEGGDRTMSTWEITTSRNRYIGQGGGASGQRKDTVRCGGGEGNDDSKQKEGGTGSQTYVGGTPSSRSSPKVGEGWGKSLD